MRRIPGTIRDVSRPVVSLVTVPSGFRPMARLWACGRCLVFVRLTIARKGDGTEEDFMISRRIAAFTMLIAGFAAAAGIAQPDIAPASKPQADISATSPTISPNELRTYRSDVEFLANPFMEGRGPGTRGNEIAAEYIASQFLKLSLRRVFVASQEEHDALPHSQQNRQRMYSSFRQEFTAGTRAALIDAKIESPALHYKGGQPDVGHNFSVLGFSASAKVKAPLAFVGYSIEKGGPDGAYSTYPKDSGDKPLEGKIAVMFRFEPMGDDGKSLWRKTDDVLWSPAAAVNEKIQAAVKRGAAGIILVSPPDCADERSKKLESTEATARWTRTLDIPVFMMTPEAAQSLLQAHDPQKRDINAWRALADKEGGIVSLDDQSVVMEAKIDRSPRTTWNVAGVLPGSGALANEYIIIGAHYDHVGYGYTGGSRSDEYGIVHPGADDNASGTAGLLLLAQKLSAEYAAAEKSSKSPDRRSILFIAFSAEEMGLIGSREFIKNSPIEAKQIYAMINLDMIGRLREGKLELSGTGTGEGLADAIRPALDASGLKMSISPGGRGPSDHASFYGAGIPVLHFFTGLHEQYHTPRDTVDTINFEGGVQVSNTIAAVTNILAMRSEPMPFTSTDRPRKKADEQAAGPHDQGQGPASGPGLTGVKVRFGIAPGNYADGEVGVLVGEVYPDTSAAEAGILTGDRLLRWNGKEIGDVEGWMTYLAEHKPGDVVDVGIQRKGEELVVKVTLKSRDQAQR